MGGPTPQDLTPTSASSSSFVRVGSGKSTPKSRPEVALYVPRFKRHQDNAAVAASAPGTSSAASSAASSATYAPSSVTAAISPANAATLGSSSAGLSSERRPTSGNVEPYRRLDREERRRRMEDDWRRRDYDHDDDLEAAETTTTTRWWGRGEGGGGSGGRGVSELMENEEGRRGGSRLDGAVDTSPTHARHRAHEGSPSTTKQSKRRQKKKLKKSSSKSRRDEEQVEEEEGEEDEDARRNGPCVYVGERASGDEEEGEEESSEAETRRKEARKQRKEEKERRRADRERRRREKEKRRKMEGVKGEGEEEEERRSALTATLNGSMADRTIPYDVADRGTVVTSSSSVARAPAPLADDPAIVGIIPGPLISGLSVDEAVEEDSSVLIRGPKMIEDPLPSHDPTVSQINQKPRRNYWATRSSVHSFACTAHSFTCSGLLASLVPSAALTRSLALLTPSLVGE